MKKKMQSRQGRGLQSKDRRRTGKEEETTFREGRYRLPQAQGQRVV